MGSLPPFAYLIFALAAFIVAAGGLAWLFGYLGGKDKKESEEQQPSSSPTSSEPEAPALADERELLRVLRTKDEVTILVQGRRRRYLREITDPQTGRDTIEAIKAILQFSEGWLPSIRQQAGPAPPPQNSSIDEESFLRQLQQSPSPASKESSGLLAPLQRQTSSNLLDPLHLVEQIDDLVQQRLQKRADLSSHRVRLTTGIAGGLRIYVGQQAFDAVDDISDPQIRTLIQDAIREWEER